MSKFSQYTRWIIGAAALASALGFGAFGIACAARDAGFDAGSTKSALAGGGPGNTLYGEECGVCHLAYPPRLLPSTSWKAIMSGLDDHFGEYAELPADIATQLEAYLNENASDRGDRLMNARLLRGVTEEAPLRITGLPYFKRKHDEIPRRMVEGNPKVVSFSNCGACHQDATLGEFDEDAVLVPF